MSTRAIIARAEGDGWKGRYHHSDGYPQGLGAALYHGCREQFGGDVEAMLRYLIDEHTGGWSNIQLWSYVDGKFTVDHAVGIDLTDATCYCHDRDGKRYEHADMEDRTHDQPHGWREEYLYVISPVSRMLFIHDTHTEHDKLIGSVHFDDDEEPDWNAMHERANRICEEKWAGVPV